MDKIDIKKGGGSIYGILRHTDKTPLKQVKGTN